MRQDSARANDLVVLNPDEALRHVGVIGTAAVIAGLVVGGVGGRVLMRIAAAEAPGSVTGRLTENGNRIGDITAGGTIELVVFVGLFSGAIGAAAYVIAEPWLAWTGRLRGLAFGLLLIATASAVALDPDNIDFALVGNERLVVAMFLALFVLYGVLLVGLSGPLEQRVPRAAPQPTRPPTLPPRLRDFGAYWTLASLAGLAAVLLVLNFFLEGVCGCEPRFLPELFVVGMGAATLGVWLSNQEIRIERRWARAMQVAGYVCLAGAVVSGTLRAARDIGSIL